MRRQFWKYSEKEKADDIITNDGAENYNGQISSNIGKHPNLGLFLNCSIDDVICREISHRMVYNEYINQEILKYKIEKKKSGNHCRL